MILFCLQLYDAEDYLEIRLSFLFNVTVKSNKDMTNV
jgi:hypothetical protein